MDTKGKYNSVLSLALEIEGLAVLLQRRGDLINPEIHSILEDKVAELYKLVVEAKKALESQPAIPDINTISSDYESSAEKLKIEEQETTSATLVETVLATETEDVRKEADEAIQESNEKDLMEIADAALIEQSEDSIPAIESENREEVSSEIESPEKSEETNQPIDLQKTKSSEPTDLLKGLTLNDRFRFRRELFKGKDDDFRNALVDLSSMTSPEEIKEYLEDDLCFDLENPDVHAFYEVIISKLQEK